MPERGGAGSGMYQPSRRGIGMTRAVAGFQAQHYKANGFFALNVKGYKFDHDIAKWGGVYGIYAFNSYGGVISDSVGAWNNDSGFYIGQTPPQTHPTRSIATRLKAYSNVIG